MMRIRFSELKQVSSIQRAFVKMEYNLVSLFYEGGTISISSRQNLHVQDRSWQVFHPMRKRRRKKRMTSI